MSTGRQGRPTLRHRANNTRIFRRSDMGQVLQSLTGSRSDYRNLQTEQTKQVIANNPGFSFEVFESATLETFL